jgi:hypothetical protein
MGAGDSLQTAALDVLRTVQGLGVYEGQPVQAAFPYAVVEAGSENDWSHKTGAGRDVRLAVILRDQGERPVRLRALIDQCEEMLAALEGAIDEWRLVTMLFLRSRLVREQRRPSSGSGQAWVAMIEYRALMLRTP